MIWQKKKNEFLDFKKWSCGYLRSRRWNNCWLVSYRANRFLSNTPNQFDCLNYKIGAKTLSFVIDQSARRFWMTKLLLCHDDSFKINGADSFVFIRSKNSIRTFCFPLFERFPIFDKKIFKYYWLKIFQKFLIFAFHKIILEKQKVEEKIEKFLEHREIVS